MPSLFAFLHHLAAFALVATIYPTVTFSSWKKSLSADAAKLRTIRRIIHWELAALAGILLCAALMARGIGFVG